jgi:hypothetical protein
MTLSISGFEVTDHGVCTCITKTLMDQKPAETSNQIIGDARGSHLQQETKAWWFVLQADSRFSLQTSDVLSTKKGGRFGRDF